MVNFIVFLFLLFLVMIIIYYVYSDIILPSLQFGCRNKLFALRDEIRTLMIQDGSEAVQIMNECLNNLINRLHLLNIVYMVNAELNAANPKIKQQIEHKNKVILDCRDDRINTVLANTSEIMRQVIKYNSLMFFVYSYPLLKFYVLISSLFSKFSHNTYRLLSNHQELNKQQEILRETVLFSSDQELEKLNFVSSIR